MPDIVCILLMDSTPVLREQLRDTLKCANAQWQVIEARGPHEATDLLIRERVTVLLADNPGLVAQARALSPDTVPVLIADPTEALPFDEMRVLAKPFEVVRLLTEVVEAIHEHDRRAELSDAVKRALATCAR